MFAVKPAVAEKAIAGNCWIRKVRVARHFPDKLVIAVEEREPIALVNAGRIFYLDKEGVLLPLFKGTYSELPVISGIIANADASVGKKISEENLKRVRSFLAEAGKTDVLSARHVSQIDFAGASDIKLKMENSPMLIEIDDRHGKVGR
jgi:cell division septal protein FtsQ